MEAGRDVRAIRGPESRGKGRMSGSLGQRDDRLAAPGDAMLPHQLRHLVYDLQQDLKPGVLQHPASPGDAGFGRVLRLRRELDPGRPAARVDGVGTAADDQVRVDPLYLVPERAKVDGP